MLSGIDLNELYDSGAVDEAIAEGDDMERMKVDM